MVFYLLSPWGAHGAVRPSRLPFDPEQDVPRNVEYYLARTSDGSTLSGVVHSLVLARLDRARSWDRLRVSLESDVGDIQDGTTREGIHLGAIAGTVDIVQRAHMGLVCATTVCGSTRVCPRSWSASNGAAQPRSPHPSRGEARGSSADHVSREGGSDPCGVPERGRGGAPGHHDGMADRPGGLLIERRGRGFAVGAGGVPAPDARPPDASYLPAGMAALRSHGRGRAPRRDHAASSPDPRRGAASASRPPTRPAHSPMKGPSVGGPLACRARDTAHRLRVRRR
jgi:hypothetical protein